MQFSLPLPRLRTYCNGPRWNVRPVTHPHTHEHSISLRFEFLKNFQIKRCESSESEQFIMEIVFHLVFLSLPCCVFCHCFMKKCSNCNAVWLHCTKYTKYKNTFAFVHSLRSTCCNCFNFPSRFFVPVFCSTFVGFAPFWSGHFICLISFFSASGSLRLIAIDVNVYLAMCRTGKALTITHFYHQVFIYLILCCEPNAIFLFLLLFSLFFVRPSSFKFIRISSKELSNHFCFSSFNGFVRSDCIEWQVESTDSISFGFLKSDLKTIARREKKVWLLLLSFMWKNFLLQFTFAVEIEFSIFPILLHFRSHQK